MMTDCVIAITVRREVSTLDGDRPPSPDIETISKLITSGALERACVIEVK